MWTVLQFALLGLGAGGAYAIAGVGLTQVYRGSGVLNLAHGATALLSATLFVWAYQRWGLPFPVAAALAVVAAGLVGGLVQVVVLYPLRNAAVLIRMIATLGVFAILQEAVPLIFGKNVQDTAVATFYPSGAVDLGHSVSLSYDRLIVVSVTVVLGLILRMVMDRSWFGLATTAAAENPLIASTMKVDPWKVAATNWALGSALAGVAGVLLVPIIGTLDPTPLLLLIVPALAAAMVGRFTSYSLTILGGLAVGVGQSLLTRYQGTLFPRGLATGWPDALPLLVIVVILVLGGTPFPKRGEIAARLPRVGRSSAGSPVRVIATAAVGAAVLASSPGFAATVTSVAALAIVGLSLVVITGLAGQTSFGQLSIAGVAALVAARLSDGLGWAFPLVVVIGVLSGATVSVVFALPAMRTRGPTLAIATLGVGFAIQQVALQNISVTDQGYGGTPIRPPSLFGLAVSGVAHPQRYAAMAVVVFGLAGTAVFNLRSSPTGRRLLAVRSSERAASASGISLTGAKTAAFVVAGGLAGLGGVLIGFRFSQVTYNQYGLLPSLDLVIFTLIGGVGFVGGPLIGAALSPDGLVTYLFSGSTTVENWLIGLSGVTLIVTLIQYPDGLAALRGRLAARQTRRSARPVPVLRGPVDVRQRVALDVRGLTVCYGPVTALDGLDLRIEPGRVVGLIGPNGAGKTSAIDAISGFAKVTSGRVLLGSSDLTRARPDRRAASGMGRSFQTVEPFEDLTVAENLGVATQPVRWWHWLADLVRRRPVALHESLLEQAGELGLTELGAEPRHLSQGHRRLLGVMRAIATDPGVLLLDEPAAGLDRAETEHLGNILVRLAREKDLGMLLVEHDLSLITRVCDYVVALDFGKTIFAGSPQAAMHDRRVMAAYLGEPDETATGGGEAGIFEDVRPS